MQTQRLGPPPPPQPSAPPPLMSNFLSAASEVDASVWHAIACSTIKIPPANSYIYYFPQGHLEQASLPYSDDARNYNFTLLRPWIPCQVLSVHFLANSSSDEAFVKILLQPLQPFSKRPTNDERNDDHDHDVVSFAKILTRSDANNGGGFSVPRYCADMILPHLDYAADPPVQNLVLKDAHNNAWEFRHIYRGTPRRHLLTTGWSKFVNAKRLIAGDSVVFMRKGSTNELFIGVRRARSFRGGGGDDGQVRVEALAAIEAAVRGMTFEVVYHPKVGVSDFVIKAEKVKDALRLSWTAGMRVRMAVETDDSSRMTWIQGVIADVVLPNSGMWRGSPWRMLQINWDDPESSHNVNRVSPWQVEYIPLTPVPIDPDYHPSKRVRPLQDPGNLPGEERNYVLPTIGLPRSFGHLNTPAFNYPPQYSASIQGARLDHICSTRLSLANGDRHHQVVNELPENGNEPQPGLVSTVLCIGSPSSDTPSPTSRNSGQLTCGGGSLSFQLFGRTIEMSRPGDGGTNRDAGCIDGGQKCTWRLNLVNPPM